MESDNFIPIQFTFRKKVNLKLQQKGNWVHFKNRVCNVILSEPINVMKNKYIRRGI